jgi:hypothetical protein
LIKGKKRYNGEENQGKNGGIGEAKQSEDWEKYNETKVDEKKVQNLEKNRRKNMCLKLLNRLKGNKNNSKK